MRFRTYFWETDDVGDTNYMVAYLGFTSLPLGCNEGFYYPLGWKDT